jgi:hypothetical protein
LLSGAVEAAKDLHGFRDGIGSQKSSAEYAFPEARHLAILVEGIEAASLQPCNLQPNGIRTDIDRCECRHQKPTVYMDGAGTSSPPV